MHFITSYQVGKWSPVVSSQEFGSSICVQETETAKINVADKKSRTGYLPKTNPG